MKRPVAWIVLAAVSLLAAVVATILFPRAFSIVALDITMNREQALAAARAIAARDRLGPPDYREAASFALDDEVQTFVELEGGGKDTFTAMLRDGLYAAYTWRVRHFREERKTETLVRFTPDGRPYGFVERLPEDEAGAALGADEARRIAEAGAAGRWGVDLGAYTLVEQAQERRPGGRVDHTFTYERASPTLNEGRYRLRLVTGGDRLTEVTHFVRIPEAFTRRYESMRSANEAIGVGSVVGMALLYVFGGIGVGLFVMLRRRMVLWRTPMIWGAVVSLLQVLATINELPLAWMSYDTAVPRSTFLAQQATLLLVTFLGFTAFFGLSFMAAETLTRAAFPQHPQLWRVWRREPGSSRSILGRTAGGFLLVSIFFAYDVLLYLFATEVLHWWSPAEALLHPDVLATYVPWLSAIANSLQAGFWEECLFRAVPLAGAALIGDRFGQRRLFLVIAFVVQALVFGAGHAPYPNQPAFARPVELVLPSIGFGLLYVVYGLLPGIVLHFAFDVVWFALPIFFADAPGIWFQKLMIVVLTLVPLWIVLVRRAQVGRWTTLDPSERNGAWTPPPAPAVVAAPPSAGAAALGTTARRAWLALGVLGLLVLVVLTGRGDREPPFATGRAEAAAVARRVLAERGVALDDGWRVMPVIETGASEASEFVSTTAGDAVRRDLLGRFLPVPRWRVRVARFEGDIAERAEEWQVFVDPSGQPMRVAHQLPEGRPGATLDEAAARAAAKAALRAQTGLDADAGGIREVSAVPEKLSARTDWTFTFADSRVALPEGEARAAVQLAGNEVASVSRYVFVPDEWQRQQRASATWRLALQAASGLVVGGILVAAAVLGVIAWSRRRFAPWVFAAATALMLLASAVNAINGWPAIMANLSTAQPLGLQVGALAGVGLVGLLIIALLVGLALGAIPPHLRPGALLPAGESLRLGIAAGAAAAALSAAASMLRTPAWADTPDLAALGTVIPSLAVAVDPISGYLSRLAVLLSLLVGADRLTTGWTRRRPLALAALAGVGFLGAGAPIGMQFAGWALAGLLIAAGLAVGWATLLRADLSMVPIALATMVALGTLARGWSGGIPGALALSLAAAALVFGVGWLAFTGLRRLAA